MTYRVAYGIETESLEDPHQLILVDLPDHCSEWDSEGVVHYLNNGGEVTEQPLVGFDDVLDALHAVLDSRGLGPLFDRIQPDLVEAVLFPPFTVPL